MNGSTLTLGLVGALAAGAALSRRGSRSTSDWRALGERVRAWTETNESYDLLDAMSSTAGGTWLSGGCRALAAGLVAAHPDLRLAGLFDGAGRLQHVLAKTPDGLFLDADGLSTREALVRRWVEVERVKEPVRVGRVTKAVLAKSQIPAAPGLVKRVAEVFRSGSRATIDESITDRYGHGECHAFTRALVERFPRARVAVVSLDDVFHDDEPVHSMVRVDGRFLDAYGWGTAEDKLALFAFKKARGLLGEQGSRSVERERLFHLTDRAKFKLDPKFAPADNAFAIEDRSGVPGIYLSPNVERWVNGHGYWRPFVAEFDVDSTVRSDPGVHGRWGGEIFIPAASFGKLRLTRVIPIDAWAREHYSSYGWVEDWQGREFDTGRPIERRFMGAPIDSHLKGYHYQGPDVRDMTPEQVREHKRRLRAFVKERFR